jgi:hypothetical protein
MIDGGATLVLIGITLQAASPVRVFVASIRRRRPNARELQRCLEFMPLPRRDRALAQHAMTAETAAFD